MLVAFLYLVIALIIIGAAWYIVANFVPLPPPLAAIIQVVFIVICLIIVVYFLFYLAEGVGAGGLPRLR